MGELYAILLEKTGVDTVVELGHRNPGNLTEKLTEVNGAESVVEKRRRQVDDGWPKPRNCPAPYSIRQPKAWPQPQLPAAPSAPAPAAESSGPTPESLGIPRPELTEITDDMTPDQIRRARIENAKATSAFNKALKAAGIDPLQLSNNGCARN
ncbi:MAG: DUF4332 domain-containing protein [Chloroflexota bacterium]